MAIEIIPLIKGYKKPYDPLFDYCLPNLTWDEILRICDEQEESFPIFVANTTFRWADVHQGKTPISTGTGSKDMKTIIYRWRDGFSFSNEEYVLLSGGRSASLFEMWCIFHASLKYQNSHHYRNKPSVEKQSQIAYAKNYPYTIQKLHKELEDYGIRKGNIKAIRNYDRPISFSGYWAEVEVV